MGKPRETRSPSPQSIAAGASLLVLIAGLGVGFYFIELRGPGLQALMSGPGAIEILMLFGALAAMTLTGHFALVHGVRQARSSTAFRQLARRALGCDYSTPDVLSQFDAAPELRDLVAMLVEEKAQSLEHSGRLKAQRAEIEGLIAGMQRSVPSLGPLRAENMSQTGLTLVALWNAVVERARSQGQTTQATAPAPRPETPHTEEVPAFHVQRRAVPMSARGREPAGATEPFAIAAEPELQSEPERSPRPATGWFTASVAATASSAARNANDRVDRERASQPADEIPDDATPKWDELSAIEAEASGSPQSQWFDTSPEPEAETTNRRLSFDLRPQRLQDATIQWDREQMAPATESALAAEREKMPDTMSPGLTWKTLWREQVERNRDEPQPGATSPAAPESDTAPRKPQRFSDWGGAGDLSALGDPHEAPTRRLSVKDKDLLPLRASDDEPGGNQPRFEDLDFPRFQPQAQQTLDDHVELTYDASVDSSPAELPQSALLFDTDAAGDPHADDVIDLRSLGAVEFKE